jgi:myotubularin-related protein 6/7/8
MGVNPKMWRTSNVNSNYGLTPSFPSGNRVPASITDEQLKDLAECWTHKRFPVLVWCHPHSKASICRSGMDNRKTLNFSHMFVGALFIMGATQHSASAAPPSPNVPHHTLGGSVSAGSFSGSMKNEATIIDAISETNPEKSLHVFDTGHQNTALLPNYPRVRFYFLGLAGVPNLLSCHNPVYSLQSDIRDTRRLQHTTSNA